MKVSELITNLATFAAQSPENGSADVVIKADDFCYNIAQGLDARNPTGVHLLVLTPHLEGQKIGIRELKLM